MLILAYAHVTCIFNKVLWNRNKLFDNWRFSYKICKTVKSLISAGMGPVSPRLPVKLLQNISMSHKFVKRSFDGSFLKYELQQLKDTKCSSFTHFSERSTPEGSRWLSIPVVCLPVWPIISLVVNILIIIEFAFAFLKYLQCTWFQLSSQTYKMTRFVRSPIARGKVPTIEASSNFLPIHHHPHIIIRT
jgi:hypothetical protein